MGKWTDRLADLKPRRSCANVARCARLALAAILGVLLANSAAFGAGPSVWQDHATGLALGGHDPLTYYTEPAPRSGRADMELVWAGATWRFVNSGNRAAFERHPEVYAPRFAGYDLTAIARGHTTPGHPALWSRYKDRIYLFHSAANRRLWEADREAILAQAEATWPALAATLPTSLAR